MFEMVVTLVVLGFAAESYIIWLAFRMEREHKQTLQELDEWLEDLERNK